MEKKAQQHLCCSCKPFPPFSCISRLSHIVMYSCILFSCVWMNLHLLLTPPPPQSVLVSPVWPSFMASSLHPTWLLLQWSPSLDHSCPCSLVAFCTGKHTRTSTFPASPSLCKIRLHTHLNIVLVFSAVATSPCSFTRTHGASTRRQCWLE